MNTPHLLIKDNNLKVVYASPAYLDIHQKNSSDIEGQTVANLYDNMPSDYLDKVNCCDRTILKENISVTYDSIVPINNSFIIARVKKMPTHFCRKSLWCRL
ncbi:hypothetical protein [Piscirickettsia litoralis]|uniref:PAS domain-containing protein n=1 Tax=Piscirickettsia litoralis TaxID=1891921 RepID=A0ABX3A436_9GAMM|nr:hypothetical protein [Piscirickettsia litoralis]ODN43389.1 hypothetical protein BGC07_11215 [Piscirickettsia litoralis]